MMTSTTIFPRTDQRHYSISVAVVVDYSVAVVVAAADVVAGLSDDDVAVVVHDPL